MFTVPYFFVRSFRYNASYRHGYLEGAGVGDYSSNRPRPLSSFDTHARWQPVTQGARSRRSYGKIEDCQQSNFSKALFEGLIFWRGLCMEGNLRCKIDWASLILRRKLTVFLCFTLYLRAISKYKLPLYLEGAYFRNFTVVHFSHQSK